MIPKVHITMPSDAEAFEFKNGKAKILGSKQCPHCKNIFVELQEHLPNCFSYRLSKMKVPKG